MPVIAGFAYFALAFAAGVVFGVARETLVRPAIGDLPAVLIEIPLMLAISAFVAQSLIIRFAIAPLATPRIVMGAVACALLVIAEALLAVFGLGQALRDHAASYFSPRGAATIASQAIFGLIPLLLMRKAKSA